MFSFIDCLRLSMLLFLTGCGLLGELADKPVIANHRRVYRAPPRPIQRAFDVMHRPVDYRERAASMRWKISIHDAVIAIEPSDPTRGRDEGSSYRDDMSLKLDDAWC